MHTQVDTLLKNSLIKANSVFWKGNYPPLPWMNAGTIMDESLNHIMSCFDIVYLVEDCLDSFAQWPLILNTAINLLGPNGLLIIRVTDKIRGAQVTQLLNTWGKIVILSEVKHADESITITAELPLVLNKREELNLHQLLNNKTRQCNPESSLLNDDYISTLICLLQKENKKHILSVLENLCKTWIRRYEHFNHIGHDEVVNKLKLFFNKHPILKSYLMRGIQKFQSGSSK